MRSPVSAVLVSCCVLLAAALGTRATAQGAAAPSAASMSATAASAPEASVLAHPAPLVFFNRKVIVMRATVGGFLPVERAELARRRIETLLRRDGPGVVAVQPTPLGLAVAIDGALAFTVAAADAEVPEDEAVDAAATRAAAALRQAIAESREGHDLRAMTIAAVLAAVATLVYGGLLWAIARAGRVIGARLIRAAGARAQSLKVGEVQFFEREHMRQILRRVLEMLVWLLVLVVTYGWISYVLELFPYTRPWGERLTGFLLDALGGILGGIAQGIPQLMIAVLILLIARFVNGLLKRFFLGIEVGRLRVGWLDQQTVRPTRKLATIAVWLLAVVMAYPYLPGASTDAFKGLSVLLGLMVSIGGASVMGQALSGLIVMYTRTFLPGDYVRVGEHEGTVIEIGVYQTRIRTGMGEELMLPSSTVLGSVTRNYSRVDEGGGYVLDARVSIGYDAPWRQVEALLQEAARRTPGLLAQPAPCVYETGLGDFYIEYRLVTQAVAETATARAQARALLHRSILDVFNEHGVQIMSPHYLGDPAHPKIVAAGKGIDPPASREGS